MAISLFRLLNSESSVDASIALLDLLLPDDSLTTYMLIDGPCRTDAMGVFDLDVIGDFVTPLFNPGAPNDISSMGAYMVDLRLAQKTLSASAFRRSFLSPWGRQHSVCIRTSQSANDLGRHLRKFLRLQRADDGRQVYLRFWDARVALPYFSGLAAYPARLAEWLLPRSGGALEQLIFETDDKWLGWQARLSIGNLTSGPHAIKPELSLFEIAILRDARLAAFDQKVASALWDNFKNRAPATLENGLLGAQFVRIARQEAESIGISSQQGIARYAALSMVLGISFIDDPAFDHNQLQVLKATELSESERLMDAHELVHLQEPRRVYAMGKIHRCMSEQSQISFQYSTTEPDSIIHRRERDQLGNHILAKFCRQDARLLHLNHRRLDLAISMTGAFGFYWPQNPLYTPYLDEICNPMSKLTELRNYLINIGSGNIIPHSIWEIALR